jgi:hypothetical protein
MELTKMDDFMNGVLEEDVFLRASVQNARGEFEFVSSPIMNWSVQRIASNYRLWLQSSRANSEGEDKNHLWFLLGNNTVSPEYKENWTPWKKYLEYFDALLFVIGKGPPPEIQESGVTWEWGHTVFNGVDAALILHKFEQIITIPGARAFLERDPNFVIVNFFDTLPEIEYAGVDREYCSPAGLTLLEYFEYADKHKGKYPALRAVAMHNVPNAQDQDDEEFLDEDDVLFGKQKPVTCSRCHQKTEDHINGVGVQHFVMLQGKRVFLEKSPNCQGKRPGRLPDKFTQHGPSPKETKETLSHSFGMIQCLKCAKKFNLPKELPKFEDHLEKHVKDYKIDEGENYGNQMRIRAAIEGFID